MGTIIHLGKFYPPDMGGTEVITQSVAQAASDFGHDVIVICFDKDATHDEQDGAVIVSRHRVTSQVSSQPLSFAYFFAAVRATRKADVVHIHAPNLLATLAVLVAGSKPKLLVHWHTDVINKGVLGKLVRPIEWLILKRADVVVATSQRYADSSLPMKSILHKVRIVPLGVDYKENNNEEFSLPIRLTSFLGTRKFILSVGRLSAYKGFPVLIEAAKRLPNDVAVIIAGDGELRSDLTELIEKSDLQGKILLAGRVSQDELNSLYQKAELFCLPSILRSEAFGVVLLEAMARGLPVVATNILGSGVSWVNEHEVSGLNVTPGDPVELATACTKILSDPQLRFRLSSGAVRRYKENFSGAVFKKNSMAVYEQMLV